MSIISRAPRVCYQSAALTYWIATLCWASTRNVL